MFTTSWVEHCCCVASATCTQYQQCSYENITIYKRSMDPRCIGRLFFCALNETRVAVVRMPPLSVVDWPPARCNPLGKRPTTPTSLWSRSNATEVRTTSDRHKGCHKGNPVAQCPRREKNMRLLTTKIINMDANIGQSE